MQRMRLHHVLEDHAVGNMFTEGDSSRCDLLSKFSVSSDIVRMSGFFDKIRRHFCELTAHFQREWSRTLLVSIQHDHAAGTREATQYAGTPHVTGTFGRPNFQFECLKPSIDCLLR